MIAWIRAFIGRRIAHQYYRVARRVVEAEVEASDVVIDEVLCALAEWVAQDPDRVRAFFTNPERITILFLQAHGTETIASDCPTVRTS